jgi:hypothetical protein
MRLYRFPLWINNFFCRHISETLYLDKTRNWLRFSSDGLIFNIMEVIRVGMCRIILHYPAAYIHENKCKCKRIVGIVSHYDINSLIFITRWLNWNRTYDSNVWHSSKLCIKVQFVPRTEYGFCPLEGSIDLYPLGILFIFIAKIHRKMSLCGKKWSF